MSHGLMILKTQFLSLLNHDSFLCSVVVVVSIHQHVEVEKNWDVTELDKSVFKYLVEHLLYCASAEE